MKFWGKFYGRPYPFLDFFCFFSLRFSFNDFSDFFFTSFWVSRALDMVISFGWLSSISPSVPNIFYNTSFSHLLHRNIISGVISVKVALYPLERSQKAIEEELAIGGAIKKTPDASAHRGFHHPTSGTSAGRCKSGTRIRCLLCESGVPSRP